MRSNRLQLVVPENRAMASTDVPAGPSEVTAMPDAVVRRLGLMEADDGEPPDDAA